MIDELRPPIAAALRDHQPPTHVDPQGLPRDEFDCCVDAVLKAIAPLIEELEDSDLKLAMLEAVGVDNWVGYDEAMAMWREEKASRE